MRNDIRCYSSSVRLVTGARVITIIFGTLKLKKLYETKSTTNDEEAEDAEEELRRYDSAVNDMHTCIDKYKQCLNLVKLTKN